MCIICIFIILNNNNIIIILSNNKKLCIYIGIRSLLPEKAQERCYVEILEKQYKFHQNRMLFINT